MSITYADQDNTLKSKDVMDFLHEQYLFWEFVAFMIEQLKKKDLSCLNDIEQNPHKYVDEFNEFMKWQQKILDTDMPCVI